jgi:long-subunit fatty acid transport protein
MTDRIPYIVEIQVNRIHRAGWGVTGIDRDGKRWRLGMNYKTELDAWKMIVVGGFDPFATISLHEKNIAKRVADYLASVGSSFQLDQALLPE